MEFGDVFALDVTPHGYPVDAGMPPDAPRYRIVDVRCPQHGRQAPTNRGRIVFLQTKETLATYRCPQCHEPILMATERCEP